MKIFNSLPNNEQNAQTYASFLNGGFLLLIVHFITGFTEYFALSNVLGSHLEPLTIHYLLYASAFGIVLAFLFQYLISTNAKFVFSGRGGKDKGIYYVSCGVLGVIFLASVGLSAFGVSNKIEAQGQTKYNTILENAQTSATQSKNVGVNIALSTWKSDSTSITQRMENEVNIKAANIEGQITSLREKVKAAKAANALLWAKSMEKEIGSLEFQKEKTLNKTKAPFLTEMKTAQTKRDEAITTANGNFSTSLSQAQTKANGTSSLYAKSSYFFSALIIVLYVFMGLRYYQLYKATNLAGIVQTVHFGEYENSNVINNFLHAIIERLHYWATWLIQKIEPKTTKRGQPKIVVEKPTLKGNAPIGFSASNDERNVTASVEDLKRSRSYVNSIQRKNEGRVNSSGSNPHTVQRNIKESKETKRELDKKIQSLVGQTNLFEEGEEVG